MEAPQKTQFGFGGPEREMDLFRLMRALLSTKIVSSLTAGGFYNPFRDTTDREDFALDVLERQMEGDNGVSACWSSRQRKYARDLYDDLARFLSERCELKFKKTYAIPSENELRTIAELRAAAKSGSG